MSQLNWHDQATIHGIQVKAYFFDGEAAEAETVNVRRVLPMFADSPVMPTLVYTEADKKNIRFENLIAQADTLYTHGSGLICLEYKSNSRRKHSPERWQHEIRLKDMLQNIVASYVAAQHFKKVTACLLRYHNVAYLLTPPPELILEMRRLAPLGMQYYKDLNRVAAAELAQFMVPSIERLYPGPERDGSAAGKVAHDSMLRRDEPMSP